MKTLKSGLDLKAFYNELSRAKIRILFVDYDGTLAPFVVDRSRAVPYSGVREAIDRIMRAGSSKLVIVSGRSIEELVPLLGLDQLPEIWGSHGWERLAEDGTYTGPDLGAAALEGLKDAFTWAKSAGLEARCELKPAGIALHWRGMLDGEIDSLIERAAPAWGEIAEDAGLRLHEFDGGIELRPVSRDKGYAVRTVLEEAGPDAIVAYLGDDETDEDAFWMLEGRGLRVLVKTIFRSTKADLWLRPPEELLEFLTRWSDASGGKHE
jgi:trehalose-phosphatase